MQAMQVMQVMQAMQVKDAYLGKSPITGDGSFHGQGNGKCKMGSLSYTRHSTIKRSTT